MKLAIAFIASQAVFYLMAAFVAWDWAWAAGLGDHPSDIRFGLLLIWPPVSAALSVLAAIILEAEL